MENRDSLLGVLETIFKRKKIVMAIVGSVFIGSIVIALLLPVYYKSTTNFYAASTDLSNPDKMFGGGNTELRYYGTSEDIDRILSIGQSAELMDFLVREFHLYRHYEMDSTSSKAPFYIREKLAGLYKIQKTKYDAIELSVEDRDPKIAAAMANAAREKISTINANLLKESQLQQIETYRNSIQNGEKLFKELGDSLASLRAKYGIYNPATQGETLSAILVEADSRVSSLNGKLASMKANSRIPRDTIAMVEANLKGAETQLEKIKENVQLFNSGSSEVNMLSEQQKNAQAQISWDKERLKHWEAAYRGATPVLHLVEAAQVPIVKSRPVRSILVVAATLAAMLFAIIGVLMVENYQDVNWKRILAGGENGTLAPRNTKIFQSK